MLLLVCQMCSEQVRSDLSGRVRSDRDSANQVRKWEVDRQVTDLPWSLEAMSLQRRDHLSSNGWFLHASRELEIVESVSLLSPLSPRSQRGETRSGSGTGRGRPDRGLCELR